MLQMVGKGSVIYAWIKIRPAHNPAGRNSSLPGSSSKRKQGMSGRPEIAEVGLIPPGVCSIAAHIVNPYRTPEINRYLHESYRS